MKLMNDNIKEGKGVEDKKKNKIQKKLALTLSVCLLIIWMILGTGTSLAWFTDTSEEVTNIFHFADFELEVSHLHNGDWKPIDGKTNIFDDEALYEPGYVQVVYLKVENKGDRAFNFKTAVSITKNNTPATNVFGQQFYLQDYLKFGVVTLDIDNDGNMKELENRARAKEIATMKLNNYSTDVAPLEPGETSYIALVVCMPEEVGNVANYRGEIVPNVELGIIVKADQIKNE